MFRSPWSDVIGAWCVEYYSAYGEAPKSHIEGIFQSWAQSTLNRDKSTVECIESFLTSISAEYETLGKDLNQEHMLDVAGKFFHRVAMERHGNAIISEVAAGRLDKANQIVGNPPMMMVGEKAWENVLKPETFKGMFQDESKSIIEYPGALGEFFGRALERGAFIGIQAQSKSCKSFMLIDLAFMAVKQRRRVAYFQAGDMSAYQVKRRLAAYMTHRPFWPGNIRIPVKIEHSSGSREASVEFTEQEFSEGMSEEDVNAAIELYIKKYVKSEECYFNLQCYSNDTLSVKTIEAELNKLSKLRWEPEIVIVDYADILAPPLGEREPRERINRNWKQLSALRTSRHCLLITATQSDADSYGRVLQSKSNFSDDRRKNDHVSGIFCINQLPEEKKEQYFRLNWTALRDADFLDNREIYVAGCLGIGRPMMVSSW